MSRLAPPPSRSTPSAGASLSARMAALDEMETVTARRSATRASETENGRRLSQTNRGLRMILTTTVFVVAICWAGAFGLQYIKLMQIQELVRADQDALRVMCAVEPPTERSLGWMHICETAAGAGPKTADASGS